MANRSCVIQFTGGRDSTLTAIRLIEDLAFDDLHFLTFKTDLMDKLEKVLINYKRLRNLFRDRINFTRNFINTQDLLKEIFQTNYFSNLKRYRTFYVSTFCPACRLSHHIHSIIYCLKNNIQSLSDGCNKITGFDLFQQPWIIKKIFNLYKIFDIEYITPIYNEIIPSELYLKELSKKYSLNQILVESQPICQGGGQFHNLYLRCYFLPLKGKEEYKKLANKWFSDKVMIGIKHIKKHLPDFDIQEIMKMIKCD